jgi:hypothetical protein
VKETGAITLGYRESSLPFSYLNRRQQRSEIEKWTGPIKASGVTVE